MIKRIGKNNLNFIAFGILAVLFCFISRINLSIPLFLVSIFCYLKYRKINLKNFQLTHAVLLYLIIFSGAYWALKHRVTIYYIPFAVIPMLATLLFNSLEVSLLITLAISVSIAAISGNSLYVAVLAMVSGTLASILVKDARKRTTIIRAGLIVGIIQAGTLILIESFWIGQWPRYVLLVLNGLVSGFIVLGVLPVFEYLFKTVTNISLLELADFHHPLLQRMLQEAAGTYQHSLLVGNLSESACEAIGANALLARIGAYYHDIGKLEKAEYFSENQDAGSKHDNLAPSMSKLIIMNHVKEGAELAKKYKLNPPIVDFITQHHGNSLVYYFYRRAVEGLEDDHEVKEEGFRYPGPRPNSKETAVVLLADSVEAACRALREAAPNKIEEVVHKIINNKFIDGQLDDCDLTLKDLEKISAVFIRLLSVMYRTRASYPEERTNENNGKKSAKENLHPSEKNSKNNP